MPILQGFPSAPRRQAFEAALLHLVQLNRVPTGLPVDPIPLPVYLLSPKDVSGDLHLPSIVKLVSFRYFAGDETTQVVTGDVSAASPPVVNALSYGRTALSALQASRALKSLSQVQKSDYELSLLRIPAALVEGFWLKPANDAHTGLIVPSGKTFDLKHERGKPEPIDDFLHTLHPVAPLIPAA